MAINTAVYNTKSLFNHVTPNSIQFGLFSSEEIKNLSVVKICTPLTFNALGHPLAGGLYDPALGPIDKKFSNVICSTCYSNAFKCPGHIGHIELPVPVINPLFHKVIHTILRLSCLHCYTILIPPTTKYKLIGQLRLLDSGYLTEALEVEGVLQKQFSAYNINNAYSDSNCTMLLNLLEKYISNVMKESTQSSDQCKSIEVLKSKFMNEAISEFGKEKTCPNCKHSLKRVTRVQNKLMRLAKMEVASKFKDKGEKSADKGVLSAVKEGGYTYILPSEAMSYLRKIWLKEKILIEVIAPVLKTSTCDHPTDMLFLTLVPVTPTNTRPIMVQNNMVVEHPQNASYKSVLQDCVIIRSIIHLINEKESGVLTAERIELLNSLRGSTYPEKLQFVWQNLQIHCDMLMDKDLNKLERSNGQGLKQIIEKKDGIIRMHMMGKRVNFAARSVITPDPNLNIDEIGIPDTFATKLTYPVPVTAWNVTELRKMVMNGPNVHPGAVMVENEDGSISKLHADNNLQRESIAKRLLTPGEKNKGIKILHRHLVNGDILLLNRQPSLHKPSIMAHKARILKGEKTLRLHYANCKSYNADFDGDEMNAHFPQNEIARSEAYNLVNVCNQYLVPKDGTPLSGLIQDHMVSGVKLSMRGKFFNREDYMQLVFQALDFKQGDIAPLPPSILKPALLWSGKQVISTVILNIIPKGKVPLNLESSSKISFKAWEKQDARPWVAGGTLFSDPKTMSEAEVIIRSGELLCGVLDKTHYGATPYSLVHCLYELYGGQYSCQLLSSLAKLFTSFLQIEGFTLGVKDILVVEKSDADRLKYIEAARKIGKEAVTKALDLPISTPLTVLQEKMETAYNRDPMFRAVIDHQYKMALDSYTNNINKVCLPAGLLRIFPENNLQLMVQSGAKGSTVNTMQISCLLGQIELEGKRPPLMVSGRSLPSFCPYDISPRAGGFIDGRFMTGIQPQEFFFHCMAGREGLIDTAVKTSRSGYLQRCLVKHLEGITVNYDMTVRDADGSVIQFRYGEDSLEVTKSQFLNKDQLPFLVENIRSIVDDSIVEKLKLRTNIEHIEKHRKQCKSWRKHYGESFHRSRGNAFTIFSSEMKSEIPKKLFKKQSKLCGRTRAAEKLCRKWQSSNEATKHKFNKKHKKCPDPIASELQPDVHFYSITEKLENLMNDYLNTRGSANSISKSEMRDMISLKSMSSICPPGEPVGLLAAQSVGEPSTQMTLNTFHFAGRGEMNVTLGIPRLREILMTASKQIKTPSMEVPFHQNLKRLERNAEKLRKHLTRITLTDVLEYIKVKEYLDMNRDIRGYTYVLHFQFLPQNVYADKTNIKPKQILRYIEAKFLSELTNGMKKQASIKTVAMSIENEERKGKNGMEDDDDDDDDENFEPIPKETRNINSELAESSDEESVGEDDDATTSKMRSRHQEAQEYQDPEQEEEEGEQSDNEVWIEENEEGEAVDDQEEENRLSKVMFSNEHIKNYRFDKEKELWCEVTLVYPVSLGSIDLSTLLRELSSKAVLHQVSGIRRAFTYKANDKLMLKTDGLNLSEMFQQENMLNINKLYSNDVQAIAQTYGIEAAAKVIVREIQDVFKVYGITVDPRHLLLIGDYMTYDGTFQPLSRRGIEASSSPLQQISFESSLMFLKSAVLRAKSDTLTSPSAKLMLGQYCKSGTGAFQLIHKLHF